jgi:hypothetical protein
VNILKSLYGQRMVGMALAHDAGVLALLLWIARLSPPFAARAARV